MGEWRDLPIKQLGRVITGATPKSSEPDSWGDEIDFITPTDQREGFREARAARRLSSVGAERLSSRIVPAGSTCFTCIGATIGKTSLTTRPAVTNQQINSVIPNPASTDCEFLYYLLTYHAADIARIASGSATPIVNKSQFENFVVRVPSVATQKAIGRILGALDDKIAVNERIARSCDELRALRFVDFIQSSPSKVIERPLSSFADFVNGRAFTKNATGTGRMVIRIAEINSGPGGSTVYNDIDVPDRHLARPGDVLFAWSGSLTVARWFRPEAIVNQHIFKVIPRDGLPNWLLFELIRTKLKKFQSIAADKATTMGHIQRRHLDEPVSAPADDVVSRLDSQLGPLWERALTAEQESLTLAALRDTLLPKLMSGELRVRDAEKAVEEAL